MGEQGEGVRLPVTVKPAPAAKTEAIPVPRVDHDPYQGHFDPTDATSDQTGGVQIPKAQRAIRNRW